MKTEIAICVATLVLHWFLPSIRYHLWYHRWAKLPGHNPYKAADSG